MCFVVIYVRYNGVTIPNTNEPGDYDGAVEARIEFTVVRVFYVLTTILD